MRVQLLAACAVAAIPLCGAWAGSRAVTQAPGATAMVADAGGTARGTATFSRLSSGVRVVLDVTGLPAGVHGVHLHATGICEAPGFTTAGGHWNPTLHKHGLKSGDGPHEGDLPNMTVAADGSGHLDATLPGATLTGGSMPLLDADGTAIVIHAGPDDYLTDPAGNSGGRIACGVVKPV